MRLTAISSLSHWQENGTKFAIPIFKPDNSALTREGKHARRNQKSRNMEQTRRARDWKASILMEINASRIVVPPHALLMMF